MRADVPPMARIEGIDVVSEGILTLTRVCAMLREGTDIHSVMFQTDGASGLLRLLLNADQVHFMVGQAVNPAHQNPELPHHLDIRLSVVREISQELQKRGIDTTIEQI